MYKIFFWRKYNPINFRHCQWKPFAYWRFLFGFYKSNFDICSLLSDLSNDANDEGIFVINLIFKKWVFVFHPQYAQELLLDIESIDKIYISNAVKGILGDSLFTSNGEKWRVKRNFLNPMFRKNVLETYIPKFARHSKEFMEILKMKNNEWIDILLLLKKYSYDIIFDTILETDERIFRKEFDRMYKYKNDIEDIFVERIFNIFLWPDLIFRRTTKGKRFENAVFIIKDAVRHAIIKKMKLPDTYKKNNENVKNFTVSDLYIYALKNKAPEVTLERTVNDVIMLMEAGSETTAIQLSWILYEIGKYPNIQKNIQKELDKILSKDIEYSLNRNNLNKMQYLECVIKETLRIHPTGPIVERNCKNEHHFGNHILPKNSTYFILIYKMHQNPDQFSNPDIFDPDRFLPENSVNRHPFSYIPFSAGARMCIGYYFAMLQMKVCIAYVLTLYNIESLPEKCHSYIKGLFLISKECLRIKLTPRNILK